MFTFKIPANRICRRLSQPGLVLDASGAPIGMSMEVWSACQIHMALTNI
jgi:hypothetical protein